MAKAREQRKDQELAKRARNMVRMLQPRIFVSPGGVFLVQGLPEFEGFLNCLKSQKTAQEPGPAPSPTAFGFSSEKVLLVTKSLLASLGNALQKWHKVICDKDARRTRKREDAERLKRWKIETEIYDGRLERLHALLRAMEENIPFRTAYVILDEDYEMVDNAVNRAWAGLHIPKIWRWMAEVVFWTGGGVALQRFLSALQGQMLSESEHSQSKNSAHKISRTQVSGLAALCAMDGSEVPIPHYLIFNEAKDQTFSDFIRELVNISGKAGYDQFLTCLNILNPFDVDKYHGIPCPDNCRQLVSVGATAEDLCWLAVHDKRFEYSDNNYKFYSEAFAEAGINPGALRKLVENLNKIGGECNPEEISHALKELACSKYIRPVESFNIWLSQLVKQKKKPAVAQRIWHVFLGALNLTFFGNEYSQLFDRWFSAKPVKKAFAGLISPEIDERILQKLELLAYYQQLGGEEIRLTASLLRLLRGEERESRELTNLEEKELNGSLSVDAAKRLNKLRSRGKYESSAEKTLRKVSELCAVTAINGLEKQIEQKQLELWNLFIGVNPVKSIVSSGKRLEIMRWAETLDKKHRMYFQKVIDAWRDAGAAYREQLDFNLSWLDKTASEIGLDLAQWLYPPGREVTIAGKIVRLAPASDPFQIFLMGSYFDTCLGLDEGCNRQAVLSNACEVNKQVLYATDENGVVLARKLVGITGSGGMIGFRTYIASKTDEDRNKLKFYIHAFCRAWAANCGVTVVETGVPDKITDLFWYNDGLEEWLTGAEINIWRNSREVFFGASAGEGEGLR
jgi:hypothetical protein